MGTHKCPDGDGGPNLRNILKEDPRPRPSPALVRGQKLQRCQAAMTLSDIPYIDDKLQEKKDSSTSKVGSTVVKSALKSSTKSVTATTSTTSKAGPKSTVGKKSTADNKNLLSK